MAPAAVQLPDRPASTYYARTARPAEFRVAASGTMLLTNGRQHAMGAAREAAEWALGRPAFSAAEVDARFPHVPAADRRTLVDLLLREGLVERYTPAL